MNFKNFVTTAAATAAIFGSIGFVQAQTDTTNRNPDGTLRSTTQSGSQTGNMGTTPGTSNSTTSPNSNTGNNTMTPGTNSGSSRNMNNSTGTMSNDTGTMTRERPARADRN